MTMVEQASEAIPAPPVPQAVPQTTGASTVVVSPEEPPKKGLGLLWFAIILGIVILSGGAYFLYTGQQKPVDEKVSNTPPNLATEQSKPNQGFASSTPTPVATPTLTSSDSVADIDKDLSGTTIEAGNSSEFDADLQTL